MKKGIELIAKERQEQIEKHGWNIEKDKCYKSEELLKAALFCIDQKRFEFPWGWIEKFRTKIVRKNRVQQLIVAGAFIAAEIDRILELEGNYEFCENCEKPIEVEDANYDSEGVPLCNECLKEENGE